MSAQNSNKTARKKKTVGKPFKKGKSGNPGGRPKLPPELKARCQGLADDVVDMLERIVQGKIRATTGERIAAGKLLLAYGYGNPAQSLTLGEDSNAPFQAAAKGSAALIARVRAKAKAEEQQE